MSQQENELLRDFVAKTSVDIDEIKQFLFPSMTIIITLLGLILYKVW